MMHKFWGVTDPMMYQMQFIMFLKNVSMIGGALLITQFGSGPWSLGARPEVIADCPRRFSSNLNLASGNDGKEKKMLRSDHSSFAERSLSSRWKVFSLLDAGGNKIEAGEKIALCRCGASTNKPFCDGTHSKIGFDAAAAAFPAAPSKPARMNRGRR